MFRTFNFSRNGGSAKPKSPTSTFLEICLVAAVSILSTLSTVGCSKTEPSKDFVSEVRSQTLAQTGVAAKRFAAFKSKRQNLALKAGLITAASVVPIAPPLAIASEVTVFRSEILGRTFLYGSDLQYSSIGEEDGMLLQAMALGHIPARFRVFDDRLQLIADLSHEFESDINRPGQLIHEFPIVRATPHTLTIAIRSASPILNSIVGGQPFRSTWVRSIEFVSNGNYLLFETSVETANGEVIEFMESLFPRETLVPPGFTPLLADPDLEPLAERFRFLTRALTWLDLPQGRTKTSVATRFNVNKSGGVIEWYVTPNVPAKYLPAIRDGIEGWNRYSQKMWGRDFMIFKGILPSGVKIGDPRYNVINWDSVPSAGAAYESQASDPISGLQSHSLIYLPYAWVQIGQDFWSAAALTQEEKNLAESLQKVLSKGSFFGTALRLNCLQNIAHAMPLEMRRTPEVFAQELLRQVLFHEAGHALGLAHNFKGSLSYDPKNPSSMFTTTIMEYNQYHLEDGAFSSPHNSDGPLLEYDRQIISALYNEGRDIKLSDPELPACADNETDSTLGGVDPFCIRYDAGSDPTEHLLGTIALTLDPQATLGRTQSLAKSLLETPQVLGEAATVVSEDILMARVSSLLGQLSGISSYYYTSGSQSLTYMMIANIRSLYVFRPGVLPATADELAIRERATSALKYVTDLVTLPPSTAATFVQVADQLKHWLKATPWYAGLSTDAQLKALSRASGAVLDLAARVEQNLLPRVRRSALGSLARDENAPFFFVTVPQPGIDLERLVLELLEKALTQPLVTGAQRSIDEKMAAARSLRSFAKIPEGADAIARVISKTKSDLARARNAKEREAMRSLIGLLEG
jgi:hypothetical protein